MQRLIVWSLCSFIRYYLVLLMVCKVNTTKMAAACQNDLKRLSYVALLFSNIKKTCVKKKLYRCNSVDVFLIDPNKWIYYQLPCHLKTIKALDTFGYCLIANYCTITNNFWLLSKTSTITRCISTYRITNLWTFWLNWSSKLQEKNKKKDIRCSSWCAFRSLKNASGLQYFWD